MSRRASCQLVSGLGAAFISLSALSGCSDDRSQALQNIGEAEISLTNAPSDVKCLRLTVNGPSRTDVRQFPLTTGQRAVFRLNGLPVGRDTFTAHAFNASCEKLTAAADPTWYSDPVVANVRAGILTHVALKMIHNGRVSVGVDFDDKHGPADAGVPPLEGGTHSSDEPYLNPLGCPGDQRAVLSAGDSPSKKADGSEYRLVGRPDGLGAFNNGDGTFTLLVNHNLGTGTGIERAHGADGSFVTKLTIRKADLAVMDGSDLIQRVALWSPKLGGHAPPTTGVPFERFASGDLPEPSALLDPVSGVGFDGPLFFNGERFGLEGRAWVHGMDGTSYEFAHMGKAAWSNIVPNPGTGKRTVVVGLDQNKSGQIYVYAGEKTGQGSPVQRAGLTNGTLFGVRIVGFPNEPAEGISEAVFVADSFSFGVENASGEVLEKASRDALVTGFTVLGDGAWDPNNPNDFYFVTSSAARLPTSRLYRLRFNDAANPGQGGVIQMLLDGSEGQTMLASVAVDKSGHAYVQEAPGNSDRLATIWRYDIASDQLSEVARHDPTRFLPGGNGFLTQGDDSLGMIDVSSILGPGTFIMATQAHFGIEGEIVEGGQVSFMHDNDGLGGLMAAIATLMVECTGKIGPDSFILQEGVLALPDNFRCVNPGPPEDAEEQEDDKEGMLRAYLSLQLPRRDGTPRNVVPNAQECIGGRWAAWLEAFSRTQITQDQCPAWRRTAKTEFNDELFEQRMKVLSQARLQFAPSLSTRAAVAVPTTLRATVPEPPDLELFKIFRQFEVGFEQAQPEHECTRQGPGACAALCAGAFPGFVINTDGTSVTADAMEWLEDRMYPNPTRNRFLRAGYYHPTWAYSYGSTVGSRMRANSCNAREVMEVQCNVPVVDQGFTDSVGNLIPTPAAGLPRSCTFSSLDPAITNDNCASELCSVWISENTFEAVQFRLDCLDLPADHDPQSQGWLDAWNTCVGHCYLGATPF